MSHGPGAGTGRDAISGPRSPSPSRPQTGDRPKTSAGGRLVPPRVRRRARAELWRRRHVVAALLVGLATTLVVHRLSPTPEPRDPVVVASTALPAGTTLTADHLRTVRLPSAVTPEGAPGAPDAVVGRTLAVPVTTGTVLGDTLLVDDTSTGPPGTVVAAVRLAEPALLSVLTPGTRVDLLAATPLHDHGASTSTAAATTLAVRALVLPTPTTPQEDTGFLSGAGGTAPGSSDLLLVAVTPDEATYLANVAGRQAVSAVVVR